MKNRRDFLKTSFAVSVSLAVANITPVFASTTTFPRGIIYTKDNPARWAKKVGSHSPVVTVEGRQVKIETKHPMSEKHYIVKHTIVSGSGEVLGEKTFYPTDEKALSVFKLKGKHSLLYATSFCNKHDLWVTEFSV